MENILAVMVVGSQVRNCSGYTISIQMEKRYSVGSELIEPPPLTMQQVDRK